MRNKIKMTFVLAMVLCVLLATTIYAAESMYEIAGEQAEKWEAAKDYEENILPLEVENVVKEMKQKAESESIDITPISGDLPDGILPITDDMLRGMDVTAAVEEEKSNTDLYIIGGAAVLVVLVLIIIIVKKK